MQQSIGYVTLVVREYDEAIAFFTKTLHFELVEDTPIEGKRWVLVRPPGSRGTSLLLGRATTPEQLARIGDADRRARLAVPSHGRLLARLPRAAREGGLVRARAEGGELRNGRGVSRPVRESLGPLAAEGSRDAAASTTSISP